MPEHLTTRGENYVLKVRGDSMIDDGILDGDLVIISRRERADNGEMVVANVNGEVTLKRLYREGETVRLQPANSMMQSDLCRCPRRRGAGRGGRSDAAVSESQKVRKPWISY